MSVSANGLSSSHRRPHSTILGVSPAGFTSPIRVIVPSTQSRGRRNTYAPSFRYRLSGHGSVPRLRGPFIGNSGLPGRGTSVPAR